MMGLCISKTFLEIECTYSNKKNVIVGTIEDYEKHQGLKLEDYERL